AKQRSEQRALMHAAGRYHGLRWGLALSALVLVGLALQHYISSLHRAGEQQRAEISLDLVANAAPQDVPVAIERLKPMREIALPLLRDRLANTPADSSQRLHVAFALAAFGEVEDEFLLERTATMPASEARNMMTALAFAQAAAVPKLLNRVEDEPSPEIRTRYAAILLHLGDRRGAQRVLSLTADP